MQKVLIVGSGRSGRGMLGELYDKAGYRPVFADINSELLDGLKKQNYYEVSMYDIKNKREEIRRVSNFDIIDINNNYDEYIKLIAQTKYISSALMPDAFEHFSKAITDAIIYRRNNNITCPVFITLGANYVGLRKTFEERIEKFLGEKLDCDKENVYLIMSIVNRKNLLPKYPEQFEDKYRIEGDNKNILRVDNNNFLAIQDDIPSFFKLEDNIDAAMAVKIWTGNVVQCSMAFVALNKGMTDTNQAANDLQASNYAYYASLEAYDAVKEEYNLPNRSIQESEYTVKLFRSEEFKDSLYRIAREPIRKFKRNDRFIGPALCCIKHNILPYYITRSLAYGFMYYNEEENDTLITKKYIEENGIEKAVEYFCELNMEDKNEKLLHNLIVNHYRDISNIQAMGD